MGHDASAVVGELGHLIDRTANLERTNGLQTLGLDEQRGVLDLALEHRCPDDLACDAFCRGPDVDHAWGCVCHTRDLTPHDAITCPQGGQMW